MLPAAAVCLNTGEEELKCRPGASPIAVIVCPTRELAQQVHRICRPLARLFPKLQAVCATGGVDKGKQMQELRAATGPWGAPQLLVGTPGRLHDLLGGLSRDEREQKLHEESGQVLGESKQHAGQSELPAEKYVCRQRTEPKRNSKVLLHLTLQGQLHSDLAWQMTRMQIYLYIAPLDMLLTQCCWDLHDIYLGHAFDLSWKRSTMHSCCV